MTQTTESPFFRMTGICKSYRLGDEWQQVLRNVDLSIEKGEFLSVLGPSGSGKSTLMNIIGCLDTPTEGEYILHGKRVDQLDENQLSTLRNKEIGFIFQSFQLLPRQDALSNVELPLIYAGMNVHKRRARAEEMLCRVGLEEKLHHMPNQLSGGQQQRVAIARALSTNPKIILCDEATSALDPQTTTSILNLLREINKKMGITIVIITHEMSVVESVCTHVAIIDNGDLVENGTVEDVFSQPKSAAAKKLIFRKAGADMGNMGERMIRIVFEGNASTDPVIASLAMECHIAVNIMYADTRDVNGKAFGQMILQLPEDRLQQEKAIYYLQSKGLRVEEVTGSGA